MTTKQLDKLLSILDRAVKVAERWADREYPLIDESHQDEIGISRVGDYRPPQSPEEYKAFEPQGPSAFEKRLRNQA